MSTGEKKREKEMNSGTFLMRTRVVNNSERIMDLTDNLNYKLKREVI
jgi:hypothetical protein